MKIATPEDVKEARQRLGMTQSELAHALRMAPENGGRTVRIWERPGNTVPGPVQVALEHLLRQLDVSETDGVFDPMAKELVEALGGTQVVANATGQTRQTVTNWKRRGVPWRWRPRLQTMAREAGVDVPAEFLNPMADAN